MEEAADCGFAHDLDMKAGIDAWQLVDNVGARGIASRVQFDTKSWDTFTIRYIRASGAETEFAKRLRALDDAANGWASPHLTMPTLTATERDSSRQL